MAEASLRIFLHDPFVKSTVETLANVLPICLFLSPLSTILSVGRKNDVGDLPPLPFTSMFANCLLWLVFGLALNEKSMIQPNAVGACLALFYISVYLKAVSIGKRLEEKVALLTQVGMMVLSAVVQLCLDCFTNCASYHPHITPRPAA